MGGGTKARTGGACPFKRSISTSVLAQLGPWLSFDVPWSRVSTLALPCAQSGSSSGPSGSYQAPHESRSTPGETVSVRTAPARQAPRRYRRAPRRHRRCRARTASAGLIATASRPATLPCSLTGPGSIWLCRRYARLARDEMQRISRCRCRAQPFGRFEPGRMRRTIVIAEARDALGIKLDAARWRARADALRIGAEIAEHHVFLGALRHLETSVLPEAIEIRNRRLVGAHLSCQRS